MKEYMEGDDPNWENPTIEDIDNVPDMNQYEMGFDENDDATVSCEYDEAAAELHDDPQAFVHDFNENGAVLADATGATPEGIDATEIADAINNNPELLEKETDFGEGSGQAMEDASGTISDADAFMAKSDDLASQSEDMDMEDDIEDNSQLEGQIGLEGMGDQEPGAELSHQEFFDTQDAFEEEIMGEREPGAEMSHQGFFDAQDSFEEDIMSGGSSDSGISDNSGSDDFGGGSMDFSE
jgi:hypothetical protein